MKDDGRTKEELIRELAGLRRELDTLRQSEERFSSIFSNIGVGVALISPQMEIISLNPVMKQWFPHIDASSNPICYKNFNSPPAEVICSYCPTIQTLQDGEVHRATTETPGPDGDRSFLVMSSAVRDAAGKITAAIEVVEDVTERKRAKDALRSSEALLQAVIGSSADAIFVKDLQGRYLLMNRAWADLTGRDPEEVRGKNDTALFGPEEAARVMADDRHIISSASSVMYEHALTFGGRKRMLQVRKGPVFDEGKKVVGVYGISRDITERKKIEDALRDSEAKYRELVENANVIILRMALDGTVTYFNEFAERFFGYSADEIIGKPVVGTIVPPRESGTDRDLSQMINALLSDPERYEENENENMTCDGRRVFVHWTNRVVLGTGGEPIAVLSIGRDITERRQAAEERLKLQKLESLGVLAGGIAHDFNNLLQGVFGYMSMARLNLDNREKAQRMLDQAGKALEMSTNLTGQLLTFSKGGKPVKKRIDVTRVIENSVKFALSGSRVDQRLTLMHGLWPVEADEGQLGQVIQNIVLNAAEAMPEGGTLEISADNVEIVRGNKPALPDGGQFVRIQVRDTGIGITEQHLSKIFDPYFTTKQKGSGLGLASSYSIVKNHGGTIEVSSEPGRGSIFSIYLPSCEIGKKEAPEVIEPAGGRSGRILLMDDEEIVRDVAKEMIEELGHTVESAADGKEALEKFRKAKEAGRPFDIVIFDLTVKGGMGGEEAIRILRKTDAEVKAIVSSGYADNPVVSDFRAYGFSAFLTKPHSLEALKEVLNALLSDAAYVHE